MSSGDDVRQAPDDRPPEGTVDADDPADDPADGSADGPAAGPDNGSESDPEGGADGGGAGAGRDEHEGRRPTEAHGERDHALVSLSPGAPPRPPRRTGVFVDADDLREHVGQLLRSILGGYEVDAFGNYTFTHEDARVFVTVGGTPIGPTVGVFSVTNLDVDLTPQLAGYLLATNHTLGFGAFSYDRSNRSVWLRHTLLGTTLDAPELQSAVAAVATTAAHLDDHIRDRFGGRTFQESPDEVQRRVEPPGPTQDAPSGPGATGYL
jgi:hypothetical protein